MVMIAVWDISSGASLVAAAAALVTIWLARATVIEARSTRVEAARAHEEAVAAQRRQATDAAAASALELAARAKALEAELNVQRLLTLGRLATSLAATADIAREETRVPPPVLSEISPLPLTRLTGTLGTLRVQVALLAALGGPDIPLTANFAEQGYQGGTAASHYLGRAIEALREVEQALAEQHVDRATT